MGPGCHSPSATLRKIGRRTIQPIAWPRVGPPVPTGPRMPFMLPSLQRPEVVSQPKGLISLTDCNRSSPVEPAMIRALPQRQAAHDESATCFASPPFIHLLGGEDSRFVLDVHTNRLFSISPEEWVVLNCWVNGAPLTSMAAEYPEQVHSILRMTEQGLFCCDRPQTLAFGTDWKGLRRKIEHERYLTILELTQQCNLRCQYCVFGGGFQGRRSHRPVRMSAAMVQEAVASALSHGDALEEIALGFYGGEPLLAFDLLKAAVRQACANTLAPRVVFSLTTNCTLMDSERAKFLRDAGFNIVVSIDGPRSMHDRYRLFPNGRGSYSATLRGLESLLKAFDQDALERISLNMVIPSTAWLPYLEDFWESEPWVPRTLRVNASIMDPPRHLRLPQPTPGQRPTLKKTWLSTLREDAPPRTALASSVFDFRMAKLHQRGLFAGPRQTFYPNGCCIPGNRKVFVTAEGEYRICERAYGVPAIGSVRQGMDLPQIQRLIEEYSAASRRDCVQCWAVGLCSLCFADAYENGKFNLAEKRSACEGVRSELEADLALYGSLATEYARKVEEWEQYDIS